MSPLFNNDDIMHPPPDPDTKNIVSIVSGIPVFVGVDPSSNGLNEIWVVDGCRLSVQRGINGHATLCEALYKRSQVQVTISVKPIRLRWPE